MAASAVTTYAVTLDTPGGEAVLVVPTTCGPEAAGRRAFFTAASLGWGDLDEITVVSVVEDEPVRCGWFAGCGREATSSTTHPILGEVPTCERCREFAAR